MVKNGDSTTTTEVDEGVNLYDKTGSEYQIVFDEIVVVTSQIEGSTDSGEKSELEAELAVLYAKLEKLENPKKQTSGNKTWDTYWPLLTYLITEGGLLLAILLYVTFTK